MFSDENISRYAKALTPVSLLLILVPLVDLSLRAFPPQFGSLQWRFATVGLLIGNIGTILLGIAVLGLGAVLRGNNRTLRVVGYLGLVLGAIFVAILALFLLDALQMRSLATSNYKKAVVLSSFGALFTAIFAIVTLISIGRAALNASRTGIVTASRGRRPSAASLVVAGQNES